MRPWLYRNGLLCSTLIAAAGCGPTAVPVDAGASATPAQQANAAAAVPATMTYGGQCEASAAVVLDESHFAVASDDSETLAIYRRGQPAPVRTVQHGGVTDLEGAARIGNTIFWLTSHSLNKDGEDKPKRKVLFTMDVAAGPTLVETGSSFAGLRARVASELGTAETALMPWLNIEGLAATPQGDLMVGLRRAPAGDARAYVVRVANPFAPAGSPAPAGASPTRTWRLDLGGRGIRSMERVGTGAHAYLILAGPRADEAIGFALYWWDGVGESVTSGPAAAFADMTPEALIVWPDGEIQILGDNEGDGPAHCSEKPDDPRPRRFPSLSLRAPVEG